MAANVFSLPQTSTIYLNVVQCKSCFDLREKDNDFHKKGVETCTNNHSAAQGGQCFPGCMQMRLFPFTSRRQWDSSGGDALVFKLKCVSSPRRVEKPEKKLKTMFSSGLKCAFCLFVVIFSSMRAVLQGDISNFSVLHKPTPGVV